MGETDLKHKVLAIVDEAGAQRASYTLKLLQSEGVLTNASTGKDLAGGDAALLVDGYNVDVTPVDGPVAVLLNQNAQPLHWPASNLVPAAAAAR